MATFLSRQSFVYVFKWKLDANEYKLYIAGKGRVAYGQTIAELGRRMVIVTYPIVNGMQWRRRKCKLPGIGERDGAD